MSDSVNDLYARMADPNQVAAGFGAFPAVPGPVYTPGLLDNLLGGGRESAPSGLIPDDMLKQLHKRALLAAGLGMMQAAHTRGQNTLAAGLGAGLKAGQEAFATGIQGAENQAILDRKVSESDRIDTLRKQVAAKYPAVDGETVPQKITRLTNMAMEYAQGGDHQTAANLVSTANALRLSVNSGNKPRYFQANGKVTRVDPDGTITEIINDGSLEAKEELAKANLALRTESVGQAGQRIGQRQALNFYSRNHKIIDWGHALNQAITTITDAKGNKYLTSSTIANFVQAADQNARLQIQMLNYFKENIDPSFTGRWDQWKQRALTGQYTPEVYEKLLQHLKNLRKLAFKEYNAQRNGEIRQKPEMENAILKDEEAMGSEDALDDVEAPAGDATKLDF
jgi:hypothetical protein